MLNKEDALKSESYYDSNGKNCGRIYFFKCKTCDTIIKSRPSGLKKHSGHCLPCSRRGKPFLGLYNILKRTAKKRGIECDLTYDEFLFLTDIKTCCYCAKEVVWEPYTGRGTCRYNLDRKDSDKGYSFDNVVVCCGTCNQMKREWFSADEFRIMQLVLKRWRESDSNQKQELMLMLSSWHDTIKAVY